MTSHDWNPNSESCSIGDSLFGHRIGDANLNRAQEALRTLEDLARFRNLHHLQHAYKETRHLLQSSTQSWNANALLTARDATGDVGRTFKTPTELQRPSAFIDVAAAAAQRLQQSLRALEEVAKVLYPNSAPSIEAIRYRSYDLNASLQLSLQRDREFLTRAKLYVLADCTPSLKDFQTRIQAIARAGADLIQLREKEKDAAEILTYAQAAIDAIDPHTTRLIMNDRADLAALANTFGLHVGQTDLRLDQARKIVSTSAIIGLSTHSLEQVQFAIQQGADYIGCGPTFPSTTKHFDAFAGLPFLRAAAPLVADAQLPAFAIGGIREENLDQVLDTGLQRVVVGNAIWNAAEPDRITERFRSRLDRV
ncbi:Thiamine-phosphate synthase [Pirellula sp. SH-Sr6A]|uniref:thiamine phosphate synthase n=1 Tax=Pirellula sp. SH-Sr6A TaxID=1632865 RepID=UPI00078CE3A0|nr:thiamine phosphate synthase [Pirellula sp. SH-Sr6A]AMV32644.1 Thiamine-phosphate synthase [Pirellula sp. SH-Sr6A]